VRANVDNYGRRRFRRFKTHLGVAYDTNPDTIEAFCEGIRELVRLHPYTRKDYYQVWLHQFSPASLDILLYIFHDTPDWQTELRERHRLMLDILRLAHKLGVEIAFPTQTIHLRQDDAVTEPSSEFVTPKNAELKSMTEGRRAARDLTRDATWLESKPPPFDFRGEMAAGSAGDG
jgi:MscS family membrane protein